MSQNLSQTNSSRVEAPLDNKNIAMKEGSMFDRAYAHRWTSADNSMHTAACVAILFVVVVAIHSSFRAVKLREHVQSSIALAIVTVVTGLLSFLIDKFGNVNAATNVALIGMCFGGTLKFLVDGAIGMKNACALRSYKHALGTIVTSKYIRYALTVILNIFVSMMLFKPLHRFMRGLPYLRHNHALVSGVVTTATLTLVSYAYSDTLRSTWINKEPNAKADAHWIHNGGMQLIISVAAVTFLASNTEVFPDEPGINRPRVKLALVVGTMCLIAKLALADVELTVTSSLRGLAVGDEVNSTHLRTSDGSVPEGAEYRVVRTYHRAEHTEYKVVRIEAEECELSRRAPYGSLVLMLVGALASSVTIFGTAKTTNHRGKIFAGFMVITLMFALPGFVKH